jgi:hypothetical protein
MKEDTAHPTRCDSSSKLKLTTFAPITTKLNATETLCVCASVFFLFYVSTTKLKFRIGSGKQTIILKINLKQISTTSSPVSQTTPTCRIQNQTISEQF